MEEFALVMDAVVHKQLVKGRVLHHAGEVGVAGVGEVVAGLPLVLGAHAGAALLRVEIGDGQRPCAVERVDGVLRQVDGVHRVGGVPVIDQFVKPQLLEKRLVEGKVARGGVAVATLLNGAAFRPVLEQHVGDGEQVAQLGVLEFAAEVCGTPVAAIGHLAGHTVVDVQALRQFLAADGGDEQDGLHAEGRQCLEVGFPLAADDDQGGGVAQGAEDEVGVEGEASDVAHLPDEVAVAADAPGHEAGGAAEEDAAAFFPEHIADGDVVGGVALVDEGLFGGEEPVVELAEGDLVVEALFGEIVAFFVAEQIECAGFVVGKVLLLGKFGHQVVEVLGGGVAQHNHQVGDAAVVAYFEVALGGLVGKLLADLLDAVGFEEGGGFGDEDEAAAVFEGGGADGLVVHPEMLPEQVIYRVLFLVGEGGLQRQVLVRDILLFEEHGGLLLDALRHLGVLSENGERGNGGKHRSAYDENRFLCRRSHIANC